MGILRLPRVSWRRLCRPVGTSSSGQLAACVALSAVKPLTRRRLLDATAPRASSYDRLSLPAKSEIAIALCSRDRPVSSLERHCSRICDDESGHLSKCCQSCLRNSDRPLTGIAMMPCATAIRIAVCPYRRHLTTSSSNPRRAPSGLAAPLICSPAPRDYGNRACDSL